MTDITNPPPAFAVWWQALPEALRDSYRAGPAIMAAHAGWVAANERIDMSNDELMPVDWRTLEPLEQEALALAGGECGDMFCDWFNSRWFGKLPNWALPKHDKPTDCLRRHPMLWDEWVACYWGTLTPEQRREHPAWKLAEEYAEDRAWREAEAAKAEGLA